MEQANAIRHRSQGLVGREEATIVVRELAVAQLREQSQSLYVTGRGGDIGAGEGAADEVCQPPI